MNPILIAAAAAFIVAAAFYLMHDYDWQREDEERRPLTLVFTDHPEKDDGSGNG